ncbi:lipid-A-disaccharide synthase [Desulfosarcina sp. OttesenSCG-928-G17]|nr:lipid-A-disaccharide synthase [Desulfosarcina sp. OttesenSCG-928-G17]
MKDTPNHIMIITGEASGDMYGAMLARALEQQDPHLFLSGIGGNAMENAGVHLFAPISALSVMGLTEIIGKLPVIWQIREKVKKALVHTAPDLLVLIDFPEFNLNIAKLAKQRNIPVLYYISPKIWAWRQRRVNTIRRRVDHMAVIFPFEVPFFQQHGVPVTFVGNPLLDRIPPPVTDHRMGRLPDSPVIGLLPGSREKEITALLSPMLEAAAKIQQRIPSARFLVSCSDSIDADRFSAITGPWKSVLNMEILKGPVQPIFHQSHLLVAASGTVTLEAALYGVPMVVVYKVSPFSYSIVKRLNQVNHISLVNLIAGKTLVPELIQGDASPDIISTTALDLIQYPNRLADMQSALLGIRTTLGESGASDRTAKIALSLICSKKTDDQHCGKIAVL